MSTERKELKKTVLEYLNSHNTMTVATAHNNVPWATTVFYANDGFTLYFISNPSVCLHCQNIARNPSIAIAIDEDYPLKGLTDWRNVKGIQMEATAEMLTGEEDVSRAVTVYATKYPFTAPYLKTMFSFPRVVSFLNELAAKLEFVPDFTASSGNRLYRATPKRVWFVDNEVSFEKRQEVVF